MQPFTILVVDDEAPQREAIAGFLRKQKYTVLTAPNGKEGIAIAQSRIVDFVLTDYKMPDLTGEEVLRAVKEINPSIAVVVMTAFGSIERAVALMKLGAFDYLQKPIELDELLLLVERAREISHLVSENRLLREQVASRYSFASIVSQSGEMDTVLSLAARVAPSKAPVLLRGESGTGKELIARAIHLGSERREGPFVTVNCAALPETLFESELFGHEKGAFTGAERQRIGRFEQADGGTLFIDEVGDIPVALQVKMLRALQFGTIERLGGQETLSLDVRIVSATNRDLEELIVNSRFREDLLYRLNVVTILIPPLRSRRVDIPILVDHFLAKYTLEAGKDISGVSREAMDALQRYDFPGNVRELENIVQRAVVLSRGGPLTTGDLPSSVTRVPTVEEKSQTGGGGMGDLNQQVRALESSLIANALRESGGNQVRAAELLKISERSLRYKRRQYGI